MNANDEAIEAWNTILFDKFTQYRDIIVGGLEPFGKAAIARIGLRPGMKVVDLGCGYGDTARDIATHVGPDGRVVGIDAAARFVAQARAESKGIENVSFEQADIQQKVPGGPYDIAFSRMGMMFFLSPVHAFRAVHAALVPGGKLHMVVWRSKAANEGQVVPENIVLELLGGHPDKGDNVTCGPGPFSMASCDVTSDQLTAAGFTNITFERRDGKIYIGKNLDAAVDFALTLGPAGEVVRLAGDAAKARRNEIVAAVKNAMAPFAQDDGVYAPMSCWIVQAQRA